MYDYDRRLAVSKAEGLSLIHRFIEKYAHILGVTVLPQVKVVDNLGSRWLGRCKWRKGQQNLMEIQKSVLEDERTLERVVAHEMCHHAEYARFDDEAELVKLRAGIRPRPHGPEWRAKAAIVNGMMGGDFVTEISDESYSLAKETKPYTILVTVGYRPESDPLMYAVGQRLTPKSRTYAEKVLSYGGAKLTTTTDPEWAHGAGIGKGWSVPRDPETQAKLRALLEGH